MSGSFLFSYSISVTAILATAFDHNRAQVSKLFYQIKHLPCRYNKMFVFHMQTKTQG